ncbi:MAG: hypothetical protein WB798_10275, partial [Nocardioidaceae bacterium]
MSNRPVPRRGLGRGLGSLIPTAPRPEEVADGDAWRREPGPDDQGSRDPVSAPGMQVPTPDDGTADGQQTGGPGSADWIGVPLPGDLPRQRRDD